LFFAFCLAISAGLIVFANRIPPEIGFLLVGFIVGALAMATWQQRRFERQWPLIQMIIDWKFVERLRNGSDPADERAL
jgi:Kef-type K+ transport system membrane component KefB